MKKFFAILLVVLAVFGSQVACSDTGDYNGSMGDLLGVADTLDGLTK